METGRCARVLRGTALSFAAECCTSELGSRSLEAFQPLAEESKLVLGCVDAKLSTGSPEPPEKRGSLAHTQCRLSVSKDEGGSSWDN